MEKYAPIEIGDLRDYVKFANVIDVIDNNTGLSKKSYNYTLPDYACIKPLGTQAFYSDYNMESGITHTIYTRYRYDADTYSYIFHQMLMPDNTTQDRIFEIKRSTSYMEMRVYSRFDCTLLQKVPLI